MSKYLKIQKIKKGEDPLDKSVIAYVSGKDGAYLGTLNKHRNKVRFETDGIYLYPDCMKEIVKECEELEGAK